MGQRCVWQPEELRSEDQSTRENVSAPGCKHCIRVMEGGVTHSSRPRTDSRDRSDLLRKSLVRTINIVTSCHHDTSRGGPGIEQAPRTPGRWHATVMVVSFSRSWRCKRCSTGPAGSTSNPGSNREVSEHDYPNRKVFRAYHEILSMGPRV